MIARRHDDKFRALASWGGCVLSPLLALLLSPALHAQTAASANHEHGPTSSPINGDAGAADFAPTAAADSDLERARNLFAYGDYPAATQLLEELVLPGRLEREQDLIDAHRMLGVAAYLAQRPELARRTFMALLYLAPDTKLDPFLTPPAVVEFFDGVVTELGDKLNEVRAKQHKQQPVPTITVLERRVRLRRWYHVLLPLGLAQWDRDAWLWGGLFLASQSCGLGIMGGSVLGSWLLLDQGSLATENRPLYQALRVANWLAAGLVGASYLASVIEAWLHFRAEDIESEQLLELPRNQLPDATLRRVEES